MTKTANENMILTKKNVENKTHSDWTNSVTSTEQGVSLWEEVDYSIYEQWLIDNPIETETEEII